MMYTLFSFWVVKNYRFFREGRGSGGKRSLRWVLLREVGVDVVESVVVADLKPVGF